MSGCPLCGERGRHFCTGGRLPPGWSFRGFNQSNGFVFPSLLSSEEFIREQPEEHTREVLGDR